MDPAHTARHARQVTSYYDRNTARFLRWGKDEGTFNLHGALWPPEVTSLNAAMHYSNELVAREIERCPCPVNRVLDLGCGVGGSLFYLGRRLSQIPSFTGISLSPLQINIARQRVPVDQKARFHFEAGCFLQLPAERFKADFSFSIEAFTHSPAPEVFFSVQAAYCRTAAGWPSSTIVCATRRARPKCPPGRNGFWTGTVGTGCCRACGISKL